MATDPPSIPLRLGAPLGDLPARWKNARRGVDAYFLMLALRQAHGDLPTAAALLGLSLRQLNRLRAVHRDVAPARGPGGRPLRPAGDT
jgi:hypothetical protein